MAKIALDIPNYTPDKGLQSSWEDGFKISCNINNEEVVISANRDGLISLAKQLLTLAQENVPYGSHFHFNEYNGLESGSCELVIEKNKC